MPRVTITLPLPPKALSPNARVHWAAKHRATRAARGRAKIEALRAIGHAASPCWPTASARVTVYAKTRQRRDRDNLLASCKAYFDGIADAGVLADDSGLVHQPLRIELDRANPRLVIEIEPLTAEQAA